MTPEEAQGLPWGTRGKDGRGPEVEKRLGDLETDHLEAILKTQKQIPEEYVDAILIILRHRDRQEQDRLKIRRKAAIEATKARSQ